MLHTVALAVMNNPLLSIVICTYNRDKYLKKCLDHLVRQTADYDQFEVLVINNRSTDTTEQVCKDFQRGNPDIHFSHYFEDKQGLSFCRNRGIRESKASIISYIDDDAFADAEYARQLIGYFQHHPDVDAVGGRVTPIYHSQEPPWMSRFLLPLVAALDKGHKPGPFTGREFPIGANMAFRRSALEETGLFHTDLGRKGSYLGSGEEKDLFNQMKKQRRKIHYVPGAHVLHHIPDERLKTEYIRKMAMGIGRSEALRVRHSGFNIVLVKWIEELLKIGATAILALLYTISGQWAKASMLVKFRFWLFGSFISG